MLFRCANIIVCLLAGFNKNQNLNIKNERDRKGRTVGGADLEVAVRAKIARRLTEKTDFIKLWILVKLHVNNGNAIQAVISTNVVIISQMPRD